MTLSYVFPVFLGFCYGSDTLLKYSVALLAWYIHVAIMVFFRIFDLDIDIAFKHFFFGNISETLWVLNSRLWQWPCLGCGYDAPSCSLDIFLITVNFFPTLNMSQKCDHALPAANILESTFATSTFLLPFWDSFAMAIYIHWATTCRGQRRGWARWQLTSELNRTPVQPGHWSNWLRWMWRLERSNGTIKQNHQIQQVYINPIGEPSTVPNTVPKFWFYTS